MAVVYSGQERGDEAEKIHRDVFETRKTRLGHDHPDTLQSMGCLVLAYGEQGRSEDAERLQAQLLDTSKKKLGEDHHITLRTMASLEFI